MPTKEPIEIIEPLCAHPVGRHFIPPDNWEILDKINQIIEYLNQQANEVRE